MTANETLVNKKKNILLTTYVEFAKIRSSTYHYNGRSSYAIHVSFHKSLAKRNIFTTI